MQEDNCQSLKYFGKVMTYKEAEDLISSKADEICDFLKSLVSRDFHVSLYFFGPNPRAYPVYLDHSYSGNIRGLQVYRGGRNKILYYYAEPGKISWYSYKQFFPYISFRATPVKKEYNTEGPDESLLFQIAGSSLTDSWILVKIDNDFSYVNWDTLNFNTPQLVQYSSMEDLASALYASIRTLEA